MIAPGLWLLAWSAGVGLQLQQATLWSRPSYAVAALLGVLGAAALNRVGTRWAGCTGGAHAVKVLVIGVCLGAIAFAWTGWRADLRHSDRLPPGLENQSLWLEATVAELPESRPDGALLVVTPHPTPDRQGPALPSKVRLFWPGAPTGLAAGQVWGWTVRLRAPHGVSNPHGLDRELWLWERGMGATGSVRQGLHDAPPQRLGDSKLSHPIERLRGVLAQAVANRVTDARTAGVIIALLVGQQSAIDADDWQLFRDTGIAHLMAISGLHITLFAWLARAVLLVLWRAGARQWPEALTAWPAPQVAAAGGLAVATAYALLAGWGVPAQRTVFMLAAVLWLQWRGWDWPWPVTWMAVLALVLTLDPWAGLQAGFWLSFVAVMLLFVGDSQLGGRSPHRVQARIGLARLSSAWGRLWREQWVMTLALAPVVLLWFGQVSVVGLVANLAAIPWVTAVVTPLVFLGVVWAPLWSLAASAIDGLMVVLAPLGHMPWAVWHLPAAPAPLGALAVLGGAICICPWPWAWRLLGGLLVIPVFLHQPARPEPGEFELLAPDVGQGSAVLIRTAHHALLYDAGPAYRTGGDAGESILVPWLRRQGEWLDRVVISHDDSDHSGGAASVMAAYPNALRLAPVAAQGSTRRWPGPAQVCEAGQAWHWDGVDFVVLHPSTQAVAEGPEDPPVSEEALQTNARSCVVLVGNGRQRVLLTGDIGRDQEVALAARHPDLQVDVLMSPHHGSRFSSSPVALNVWKPRWVLIQAGHLNRFGHPAAEVIARYEARGAAWVASPACGEARWHSQRAGEVRCWRQTHPRYWHWQDRRAPLSGVDASDMTEPPTRAP